MGNCNNKIYYLLHMYNDNKNNHHTYINHEAAKHNITTQTENTKEESHRIMPKTLHQTKT